MQFDPSLIAEQQLSHFALGVICLGFLAGLAGAFALHVVLTVGEWVVARFMAWEERAERIATARARAVALSKAMPRG